MKSSQESKTENKTFIHKPNEMKTREEILEDLKPAKTKYIVMIRFTLSLVIPGLTIINNQQEYQEQYQSILEQQYDETTFQTKVEELKKDTKEELQIWGIIAIGEILMIVLVWFTLFHNKNARNCKQLIKAIKEETVQIQSAKITGFRYDEQRRNNSTSYGYHVLVENDQHQVFESDFLSNAKVYDTTGEEMVFETPDVFSMIKKAYQTYKNTDSTEDVKQAITQEIKEMGNPDTSKMDYLTYKDQTYHIGDRVEVYVNPDNESSYYVNL